MTSRQSTAILKRRNVGRAEIELRRAHQGYAERAARVAESGSLRHRGHLHHAQRDADDRAQHQRDQDPLVFHNAVVQQSAANGQHHAQSRRPTLRAAPWMGR